MCWTTTQIRDLIRNQAPRSTANTTCEPDSLMVWVTLLAGAPRSGMSYWAQEYSSRAVVSGMIAGLGVVRRGYGELPGGCTTCLCFYLISASSNPEHLVCCPLLLMTFHYIPSSWLRFTYVWVIVKDFLADVATPHTSYLLSVRLSCAASSHTLTQCNSLQPTNTCTSQTRSVCEEGGGMR